MKRFRVRFTLRQMMIAIVVVALLTTVWLRITPALSRRWEACQATSERHVKIAQIFASTGGKFERLAKMVKSKSATQKAARSREQEAAHRDESRKQWWAFFNPWHECVPIR